MRLDAGIDEGDMARVHIEFDPEPRVVPMHPKLRQAFAKNKQARTAFQRLSPSHQKEILRYLQSLKTAESAANNVEKLIVRLVGKRAKRF